MLCKGFLKREVHKLVNQSTGKWRTLSRVRDEVRQGLKERNLGIFGCLGGENVCILFGNIGHCIVKDSVEVALSLLIPQVGNQMVWFQHWYIWRNGTLQKHPFIIAQFCVSGFPLVSSLYLLGYLAPGILDFITELVVQKLVQEYLSDYLILVTIIAHTVSGTG